MPRPSRNHKRGRSRKEFNPDDARHVKHTKIGVWDLYEEKDPQLAKVPVSSKMEPLLEILRNVPYIRKMILDIGSIEGCWSLLLMYITVELVASLVPAVSLWYTGQMLKIVETAIEHRTVDRQLLMHIAMGRIACTLIGRVLEHLRMLLSTPLNRRIKHYYSGHIFHAMARLDVPTFEDPAVQQQLESAWSTTGRSVAWQAIRATSGWMTNGIRLFTQLGVLIRVLQQQQDGLLLAGLSIIRSLVDYLDTWSRLSSSGVWAATTTNDDYIRTEGMKKVVDDPDHRKEIVAGNLSYYLTSQFRETIARISDDAGDFRDLHRAYFQREKLNIRTLLKIPLRELPEIVFTLRAVQYPASIPLSLASLNLIQHTTSSFVSHLSRLVNETGSVAELFSSIRELYEIANIPNKVVDGKVPFPQDLRAMKYGLSIEFRNVSFKYPGSEDFVLRDVSFKIEHGQLCVIVGSNGSGKSTILKLIARLYDPIHGEILINGIDIRSLKLPDLRSVIAVLFQDYTHFPLSIKENIGLGDPDFAQDEDRINDAARLGGADGFIDRLPDGFDTYLNRPVRDYYSGLSEWTTTLFGRKVDFSRVRGAGGMESHNFGLSGGQMQRLAVSRTFMKTLAIEDHLGLLLFDEPSASLDPTAEHDLFERLRRLRGAKTMIFSSHRFGNLTRHADLILYMDDGCVVEAGTHDHLISAQGRYAKIWNLQAQTFLP